MTTTETAPARRAQLERRTRETAIALSLDLDGTRQVSVDTGLGFLDHMLTALAFHARWDLTLTCRGDRHVDDHHTVEDCGLALGEALLAALGPGRALRRFGEAHAPLDEALARAVVDVSGRPHAEVRLGLRRERLGEVACENLTHALRSFALAARLTLHVDLLRGDNDHHRAEAAFKAVALALRQALTPEADDLIPSTKGTLT